MPVDPDAEIQTVRVILPQPLVVRISEFGVLSSGGSGGGSFLSNEIARVDPSGDDGTGTVGDIQKPFLTVQGAIDAIEAGSFTYPIIDIGNNRYESTTVTTSLSRIRFMGIADELLITSFARYYSKVCRFLICTGGPTVYVEFYGCEVENLTAPNATGLKVLLDTAGIVGNNGAITGLGTINICGNGQLSGVVDDVVTSTGNGTITIQNAYVDVIDSGASNVVASYGSFIRRIDGANNVSLSDSKVQSNSAGGVTTYNNIMLKNIIFPDSDPHIAGAGYWVAGTLTKSAG